MQTQLSQELSPGEVHFLWWFMQGSIMDPDTRRRLRLAWGMCERHAVGALAVEVSFRPGYLHGASVLYADLMERAAQAFRVEGPLAAARIARRLACRGRCLMCEEGYGPASRGFISAERLRMGRNLGPLHELLDRLRPHWQAAVCRRCAGVQSTALCRVHLASELHQGSCPGLAVQRELVNRIASRVGRYCASFRWEMRGSDTAEDRAALLSAVGWCGGWSGLMAIA